MKTPYQWCGYQKSQVSQVIVMATLLLPIFGNSAEFGTRQQTILPRAVAPNTDAVAPSNVAAYLTSPYGLWDWGAGTNEGKRLTLMPAGYTGTNHVAQLLSFFSMAFRCRY